MRILVTGGTGLIGRHCIDGLVKSGHDVCGVYSSGSPPPDSRHWFQANLLNESDRTTLIDQVKPEVLIHLAWDCGNMDGSEQLDWLASSLQLIRYFHKQGGQSLFTAGTSMEYAWDGEVCNENTSRFDSSTLYGHAKHGLWKAASECCLREGLTHCHGRIFFLCGPGQERTRLVPSIIHSMLTQKKFVCKSAHLFRDYLDVREVAKAINALVLGRCTGDFNIASGVATKIEDIVKMIVLHTGSMDLVEFAPSPANAPLDATVVADVEKLSAALAYAPSFDLEKTILETIQWMKENSTP